MKRNMSNMNNIMTRLFTVIMLMMFSVGIQAQVKVFYGENGDDSFKGGKVGVKGQTKPDEKNNVTVTLIVTPDKGYTITKKDIKVYATLSASARATRGLEISKDLTLDGDDPKDLSAERTYTVTLDANLGLWVKEATFTRKIDGAKNTPDYSGKYFIGTMNQTDGYYLCPTEEYYSYDIQNDKYISEDNGNPFLTTYKCKSTSGYDVSKALWIIEKHPSLNYYYIKHANDNKYLTYNKALLSDNKGRLRVHLEDSPANADYALFKIEYASASSSYDIISKYAEDNKIDPDQNQPRKYLNINKGNKQDLKGTNADVVNGVNVGGIIGLWRVGSAEPQATGRFFLEEAQCSTPIISFDASTSEVTITSKTAGATIYYTIDGSAPDTSSSPYNPENKPTILETTIVKAIAVKDNLDYSKSELATATIVVNPTITLTIPEGGYTYDGEEKVPVVASVVYDADSYTFDPSEYEVSYSDNTNAGTATVTITGVAGGDYFVYGTTTFTIDPAMLHEVTLSDEPLNYNGESQSVSITSVTAGDGTLVVPSDDYTVSGNEGTNVGDYTITVTAKENTNYTGFVTNTFTISPKSLGNGITPTEGITIADITRTNDTYSNPGIYFNGTALTEGGENHYTVTTSGGATSKYYIVTFTGANNFTGSVESKFVNVDFYPNDAATCWASSFVINSGEGAFAIPDGYSAHIVTGIDGTTVTAPSLTYVPEGVPVILLADTSSDADAKGFAAQPISGDAPDTSGNMLKFVTEDSEGYDSGSESKHFDTGDIYLLFNGEFVLNKEGNLAKGKVYLDPNAPGAGSTPAPARLAFLGNPYTDIENVSFIMKEQETDEKWYSLDGCRLNGRPTKKGLYLMNRKKVVIK